MLEMLDLLDGQQSAGQGAVAEFGAGETGGPFGGRLIRTMRPDEVTTITKASTVDSSISDDARCCTRACSVRC